MTGLIIPDNVAAPAGSRLSLLMAASKFREAAKDYEEKGSKPVPSRLRILKERFDAVERAFMANLKNHPKRDELGSCVEAFVRFAVTVTALERQGVPTFHPAVKKNVLELFQAWKTKEREYAELGYKTVPLKDLFLSLMPLGFMPKVHEPLYCFLLIERASDELPVFYAEEFEKKYAKEMAEEEPAAEFAAKDEA